MTAIARRLDPSRIRAAGSSWIGADAAAVKATPLDRDERSLLRAAVGTLAVLIFAQKFAVPPDIEVGFFAVAGLVAWMVARGYGAIHRMRAITFLVVIGAMLTVVLFNPLQPAISVPAVLFFIAVHAPLVVTSNVRRVLYLRFLLAFQVMAIIIAAMVFVQWAQQFAGMTMISLEDYVPEASLFANYNYIQKIGYYSRWYKPNAFFMLETSHTAQLLAMAVMVELCIFKRIGRLGFLLIAQVVTFGGTGLLILFLAVPIAIFYLRPKQWVALMIAVPLAVAVAAQTGVLDNAIGRATELSVPGTSGNGRFTAPFQIAAQSVNHDIRNAVFGIGPGNFSPFQLQATDTLNVPAKLAVEYGLIVMVLFMLWFHGCLFTAGAPIIVTWVTILQFDVATGGFLVPLQTYYCVLLSGIFVPRSAADPNGRPRPAFDT